MLIISTPYIIADGFSIFEEEAVELMALAALALCGTFLFYQYSLFVKRQHEAYDEMVRHVGALNLQINQVEKIVRSSTQLPSTENEMKRMFEIMGNTILSIVNVEWVFLRVINTSTMNTITEKGVMRGGMKLSIPEVSNRVLCEGNLPPNCIVFTYECGEEMTLFTILPLTELSDAQTTIIQTVTTNTGMMFQIFRTKTEEGNNKH